MCDYSLELYQSRKAVKDETLTVHRFPSSTIGFISGEDCATAVCVVPGSLLRLDYADGKSDTAVFAKIDTPVNPATGTHFFHHHRDGLKLSDGRAPVSLQTLQPGTKAVVLMVGAPDAKEDAELASPETPVLADAF